MKNMIGYICSLFLLGGVVVLPQTAYACLPGKEEIKALFEKYDANHNGVLSEEEYINGESGRLAAAARGPSADLKKRFQNMDKNHDGNLSLDEFMPVLLKRCL